MARTRVQTNGTWYHEYRMQLAVASISFLALLVIGFTFLSVWDWPNLTKPTVVPTPAASMLSAQKSLSGEGAIIEGIIKNQEAINSGHPELIDCRSASMLIAPAGCDTVKVPQPVPAQGP